MKYVPQTITRDQLEQIDRMAYHYWKGMDDLCVMANDRLKQAGKPYSLSFENCLCDPEPVEHTVLCVGYTVYPPIGLAELLADFTGLMEHPDQYAHHGLGPTEIILAQPMAARARASHNTQCKRLREPAAKAGLLLELLEDSVTWVVPEGCTFSGGMWHWGTWRYQK